MRWTGWKCNGSSQQGETEWESMHGNHNCCNQWSVDTILNCTFSSYNKNTRLFTNGWLPIWTTPPEASTSLKDDEWPVVVPGSKTLYLIVSS